MVARFRTPGARGGVAKLARINHFRPLNTPRRQNELTGFRSVAFVVCIRIPRPRNELTGIRSVAFVGCTRIPCGVCAAGATKNNGGDRDWLVSFANGLELAHFLSIVAVANGAKTDATSIEAPKSKGARVTIGTSDITQKLTTTWNTGRTGRDRLAIGPWPHGRMASVPQTANCA